MGLIEVCKFQNLLELIKVHFQNFVEFIKVHTFYSLVSGFHGIN